MQSFLRSFLSQKRIAGGAAILASTQLASALCGFFRDQAFSIMFPPGQDTLGVASAYIAAFRPSDLLFQVFVMSSLSVVLVPFLAGHLAHGRREEMDRIVTSVLIVFGLAFGSLALVLMFAFPWIAPHLVRFEGDTLSLYIHFGQFALLTNFLFVFGNTLGQYLISIQRYWVYGLTPIVWSVSTILGIYFLSPVVGPLGPMVGTLIGTILYLLWRFFGVVRAGFRFHMPETGFLHRELKDMGWLVLPRMASLGALQFQLLMQDRIGSGLGNQMVALNQFANNFESVIPGIVGISIAQSAFSLLSQAASKRDVDKFRVTLKRGILFNLALALPGAIVLAACVQIAAWLLHLPDASASIFRTSLLLYTCAVPFESTNHILLRSFYSLKDTTRPAVSSVFSASVAVSLAFLLAGKIGIFALAVGYVAGQVTQTAALSANLFLLWRRKI